MKKVLLHCCCAPCAIIPVEYLRQEGLDITGYWYNPNIHPFSEYQKRLDTLYYYAHQINLSLVSNESYDLQDFFLHALQDIQNRCRYCYYKRLKQTALSAIQLGYPAFSTTLFFSKYMKHDQVLEEGKAISKEYDIELIYRDFRPKWQDGMKKSKLLKIYRQQYCGCLFSEYDRYFPKS